MKRFQIDVEEMYRKSLIIEAETEEKAIEEIQKMYDNGEIPLTSDDFQEVGVYCAKEIKGS